MLNVSRFKTGDKVRINKPKTRTIRRDRIRTSWLEGSMDYLDKKIITIKDIGYEGIIYHNLWAILPEWCTRVVNTIEELNKEALLKRYE